MQHFHPPPLSFRLGAKYHTVWMWLILVMLVLCVSEISARVALSIPVIASRLWENEDLTWQRDWVARHRGTTLSTDALRKQYPDRYDPTKGWLPAKNLRNAQFSGNKPLSTNSRGLRGTTEFPYEAPRGRTRVLLLGDSFTFGAEVTDTDTYAHRLQTMLPAVEVVNLGVDGYGHDQMLIYFQEEGVKYGAAMVILGFIAGDMNRNTLAFRDYAKPRFLVKNGTLTLSNSPVPAPDDVLKWDWARPRLYDLWSLAYQIFQRVSGRANDRKVDLARRILDTLTGAIVSSGAIPVFVYLPVGPEMSNPNASAGESFMLEYCRANGQVKCFSARPRVRQRMEHGSPIKKKGHWDAEGHRVVAEAMRDFLTQAHLVASDSPTDTAP